VLRVQAKRADLLGHLRPAAANRLLSFIKRAFAWAEEAELIDANPALSCG
jgi:hypothetical protein